MCRSRGCGVLNAAQWLSLDDLDGLDKRPADDQDGASLSHRGVVVNPSIGEVSISMGSGSHLERLGPDGDADADVDAEGLYPFGPDREDQSVSNVAIAGASLTGASLAGSIAGVSAGQRLEIQVDVAQTHHRFSMSSETASAATSLSEKSVSASLNDDGAASTRALAGSIANYKMDSVSGVVNVEDTISGSYEELAAGPARRSDLSATRRRNPDRQTSDTESAGSCVGASDDCVSVDRVRFDDNVSFIEATSSPISVGSARGRGIEKNTESIQQSEVQTNSVPSLKSMSLGVFRSSGASSSTVDKQSPKLHKSSHHTEVDLSGIEISVDGKPFDVIVEPCCVSDDSVTASFKVSVPIEIGRNHLSTHEVSSL